VRVSVGEREEELGFSLKSSGCCVCASLGESPVYIYICVCVNVSFILLHVFCFVCVRVRVGEREEDRKFCQNRRVVVYALS